ncbi:MAG: bifunctional nuclease family protein [Limisphaerales bacterium]
MKNDPVQVQLRGIVPGVQGWGIFLGNDDKVFVIQVEEGMGRVIHDCLQKKRHNRPLTHDLLNQIFNGFGIQVDRVVITELRDSTYIARLTLREKNDLGTNVVELDARPSDCLALAVAKGAPIFVSSPLFQQVEDATELLSNLTEQTSAGEGEGA